MQTIDREGVFRGRISEYGLRKVESGAVSLAIKLHIEEAWNEEMQTWDDWRPYEFEAPGDLWVVTKEGKLNSRAVESLCRHCDWDGNIASLVNNEWVPAPCQVLVKRDDYNNLTRFKIAFINAFNRTPGQLSNIDATEAKDLQARFGGELRAIAGNVKRNTSAPNGSGPNAPPRPAQPTRQPAATAGASNGTDREIPF